MPKHPEHVAVWFEIPVSDLTAATAFYAAVLDQDLAISTDGPNPMTVFKTDPADQGVSGHLYPSPATGAGPTIHLMAPDDLGATRARIERAGGMLEGPDIEMPFGSFFYARDLDGNSIGLFRPKS